MAVTILARRPVAQAPTTRQSAAAAVKRTQLAPSEEAAYRQWMRDIGHTRERGYAVDDEGTGTDYDYRGFFKERGAVPIGPDEHFPDTYKLPTHPTFSNESQYAQGDAAQFAGQWRGDTFVPAGSRPPPSAASSQVRIVRRRPVGGTKTEGYADQLYAGFDEYRANRATSAALGALGDAETVEWLRGGGLAKTSMDVLRGQIRLERAKGNEAEAARLEARLQSAEAALQDPTRLARFDEARTALVDTFQKAIQRRAELMERAATVPLSDVSQRVSGAESFREGFGSLADDPIRVVAELGLRSAPNMIEIVPAGIGGGLIGGPPGAAAGMFAGSFGVEYRASIAQGLQEAGVDLNNAESMLSAAANKELMESVFRKAAIRAGIIGTVDAATGMVAGRVLSPFERPLMREATNLVAQTGVQAVGGATGEAGAQLATEGEIRPGEVLVEGVAEGVSTPADIVTASYAGLRDTAAERAAAREQARIKVLARRPVADGGAPPAPPPGGPPPRDAEPAETVLGDEETEGIPPKSEPFDQRLKDERYRGALTGLGYEIVPDGGVSYVRGEDEKITGRTPSQNPEWFQGMRDQGAGITTRRLRGAIDKAVNGEELDARERRAITYMLDYIDEQGAFDEAPVDRRALARPGEAERRQDVAGRVRVGEMTPEQMRAELLTSPLTGLQNRRAYDESDRLPVQVAIDADSLKWVNDTLGHEAGDEMLRAIGGAIANATDRGYAMGRGYHMSGDEFVIEGASQEEVDDIMEQIEERLSMATIEATSPEGETITLQGLGISYGRGATLDEADQQLRGSKAERERQGLRASRGEQPPTATRSGGRQAGVEDQGQVAARPVEAAETFLADEERPAAQPAPSAVPARGEQFERYRAWIEQQTPQKLYDAITSSTWDEITFGDERVTEEEGNQLKELWLSRSAPGKKVDAQRQRPAAPPAAQPAEESRPERAGAAAADEAAPDHPRAAVRDREEAPSRPSGVTAPQGYELGEPRRATKEEAQLGGGAFTAVATRTSPFSAERGFGDTAEAAQRDALRRVGAPEAKAKPKVSANKVFTEDAAEKARALLRSKLSTASAGIDPEVMQAGITLAGYHIEKGARTFKAYVEAMIADLGEAVRPYLKSWYMAIKYDPRAAAFADEMDDATHIARVEKEAQAAIEKAAHAAATSQKNELPQPSQAQKEANGEGNYKLGDPVKLHGVTWRVENPRGSFRTNLPTNEIEPIVKEYRRGRKALVAYRQGEIPEAFALLKALADDIKGDKEVAAKLRALMDRSWYNKMPAHYARAVGVKGADGDALDAFLGPRAADETLPVFVIDTNKLSDGKTFDESKVMIGFADESAAHDAFGRAYERNVAERIFRDITPMTPAEFRAWIERGGNTRQAAGSVSREPLDELAQRRKERPPTREELIEMGRAHVEAAGFFDMTDDELLQQGEELYADVGSEFDRDAAPPAPPPPDAGTRPVSPITPVKTPVSTGEKPAQGAPVAPAAGSTAASQEAAAEAAGVPDLTNAPESVQLALMFAQKFASGEAFPSIIQARRDAGEFLGRQIKPGTPDVKLVDEAIELGAVFAARMIVAEGAAPRTTYDKLVALYGQMPNLGTRTSTSVQEQAYSTPLPLAYLAARAAGIDGKTTVYEPSAGNGALLITADSPEKVTANELNDARAANLRAVMPEATVTTNDAAAWRPKGTFDVVIGNPPFGVVKDDAGKTKRFQVDHEYDTGEIDHAIAMKALEGMKDDGAAVLIVGSIAKTKNTEEARSDAYNSKSKREFYLKLYGQYNVVDHYTVDGDLYAKQGAGWPIDVIVIRGRGKSAMPVPAVQPPKVFDTWAGLAEKLDARYESTGRGVRAPDRGIAPSEPRPEGGDGRAGGGRGEQRPDRQLEQPAPGRPADVRVGPVDREPGGARPAEPVAREPAEAERIADSERPTRRVAVAAEGQRQVPYKPASSAPGMGTLVPVNMQTATEDALELLKRRVGNIEQFVADRLGYKPEELGEYFGAEQIDALALGIDNLERGAGFIIGDQTGIGKGRVVAAVLRYAMRAKRTPIFITEKPNLYGDMYRDLTDIGIQKMLGREPEILMTNAAQAVPLDEEGTKILKTSDAGSHNALLNSIADDGTLGGKYDMVFTTYSQMQTLKGESTPRMRFLETLGNGGIVVFDESHNAGGSVKQKEGKKPIINRSTFARQLAGIAHGVFYSSATYAKRPDVMDLYASTDMRLAVSDISNLAEAIQKGGVPMQQVVAAMLAGAGQYVRRERSFDGIKYNATVVNVDRKTYADYSNALAAIQKFSETYVPPATKRIDKEMKAEGKSISPDGSTGGAGAASTNFTAVMHNLIDQMLLSITADSAADAAIAALKAGEKPVITVANTMGAFIEEYVDGLNIHPGDALSINFNSLLTRYLERTRWISIRKPFQKGPGIKHYLSDDEIGPAGVDVYERTKAAIKAMDFSLLPVSPIDHIRQRLLEAGYKVGEITGRQHTLDYSKGGPFYRVRSSKETSIRGRRNTISGFNRGDLDAMVINQAGSTGLSLHASEKFKDKRKRRMILAQAEKNIDTHMQMLGRVNRTGQVVLPEYDQLVADVPAIKRPAAVLSKKMASLNANTTAARGHALKAENVPDFINEYGDLVAARLMADDHELHERLGEPLGEPDGDGFDTQDAARKVTGRIPLLPIEEQERLYEQLETEYAELLRQKEAAGESVLEAKTLDLDARVKSRKQIIAPQGINSPFADGAYVEEVEVKRLGKPHTTDEVLQMVSDELKLDRSRFSAEDMHSAVLHGKAANSKVVSEVEDRVRDYRRSVVDELISPEGRANAEARIDGQLSRFRDLMQVATVGRSVRLQTNAGNYFGVVVKVEQKGEPKNPLALSTWKVTIAMADSSRKQTIPMSQLEAAQTVGDISLTRTAIMPENNILGDVTVIRAFDELQTETREPRTIVTGNLLAGFEHVGRGTIINFTDAEGGVRQGVLMPRGYNYEKARSDLPVALRSADQILQFVRTGHDAKSTDRAIIIKQHGDGLRVEVAESKKHGGRYYLNRQVLNAIGGDFVSVGNRMRADISETQADTVIEALKRAGASFEADENLKVAAEIAGTSAKIGDTKADEGVELLVGTAEDKGKGLGIAAAKKFVDRLVGRWVNLPARIIVTTRAEMRGMPENLQRALERRDPRRTSRGMHVQELNAVWVFADNIPTKRRLAITVIHEILGHYAAYEYFGGSYNTIREFMLKTFPEMAARLERGYRQDMRTTKGRNIVGNELIAWIATEMEMGTATQRMKNAFERFVLWLNRNLQAVFGVSIDLTTLEARDLIRQASRYIKTGVGAPMRTAMRHADMAVNLDAGKVVSLKEAKDRAIERKIREAEQNARRYAEQAQAALDEARSTAAMQPQIDAVKVAPTVRFGMEPEWSAESRRHKQTGEPNSVVEKGRAIFNKGKVEAREFSAYDADGNLAGVLSIATKGEGTGAFKITVRPDAQRRGIGSKLLDAAKAAGVKIDYGANRYTAQGRALTLNWLKKQSALAEEADINLAAGSDSVSRFANYWRSRTWDTEAEAREFLTRRIKEDNERYGAFFGETDPTIVRSLKFKSAAGGKVRLAGVSMPRRPVPNPFGTMTPEGKMPDVDWTARDMADEGTETSILREYGEGVRRIYRAWVRPQDLPKARGADITNGLPDDSKGFNRDELERRGRGVPPIKIKIGSRGKVTIQDGNHRLAFWSEQDYDYVPVYVIDARPNQADVDLMTDPEHETELNLMLGDEAQSRSRNFFNSIGRAAKSVLDGTDTVLRKTGKGQPLDRLFRVPFALFGSIDPQGVFHLSPKYKTFALRAVGNARAMMASPRFRWLRHTAGMAHASLIKQYGVDDKFTQAMETVKRGLIDRYGLDKPYIERELKRQADERALLMQGRDVLKQLADEGVEKEEAAVLYRMLTGGEVTDADMAGLAAPIRGAIDAMGAEAVELGLLSPESYERNRGAYLNRSYKAHELNRTSLAKWASDLLAKRRRKIIGNQFKGRGIFLKKPMARVLRDVPEDWWGRSKKKDRADAELLGRKFRVFDRVTAPGEGTKDLSGIAPKAVKERVLERIYWPADLSVPMKLAALENRGIFEVRDVIGGQLVLWRDFTPEERERMGEIVDARYAIAKTYQQMAHDLSTGRFFRDIAENPEWASKDDPTGDSPSAEDTRLKMYADAPWVRVPDTKIEKSNTYRYGALAGMYVRSEIWRDLVEIGRMQKGGFWREVMKQWKLNKTARNPVVHFNNIMSNILLMDMADVRLQDFVRGLRSYSEGDEHYKAALQHGAFGSDIISQEIRDQVLKPILAEIENQNLEESRTGVWGAMTWVLTKIKNADQKMIDTYRLEDELFRMATYMRKVSLGLTPEQAAASAREQFLNYDIRAPWINALRETVLPFVAYTYRAVPIVAKSLADRPWKLAKYYTIAYLLNALAYAIAGDDDEEEQRATLRPEEQGSIWGIFPRMLRTPFNDQYGNPIFLDIRRFIPAGDFFDMNQGSSALAVPAPLQFGGPLMIGAELMLNRQGFNGEEITNELTDTGGEKALKVAGFLWKSAAPSAPWFPGSWYQEKIISAATGELDPMMRESSVPLALANSFGVKLKPHDVVLHRQYAMMRLDAVDRALNTQLNALARDYSRRRIDLEFYQAEVARINEKRLRVAEERGKLAPQP